MYFIIFEINSIIVFYLWTRNSSFTESAPALGTALDGRPAVVDHLPPLLLRLGHDGERVQTPAQLLRQRLVHHSVTIDEAAKRTHFVQVL